MNIFLKKIVIPALIIINIIVLGLNIFYGAELRRLEINVSHARETLEEIQEVRKSEENKLDAVNRFGSGEKISVCLDPGHGRTSRSDTEPVSPGSQRKKAANVTGAAGEEEFNLAVALLVRDKLMASGISVDMTRTTHESDMSNIERAEQGNNSNYCIRIHADGSEDTSAQGVSVLIPEKSYYGDEAFVSRSTDLARCVLDETVSATGAKNNGLVTRSDMTGFNWSKVPVILIECGFLSNPEEKAKLQTPEYQEKIADGIVNGFLRYIRNIEKDE